MAKGGERFIPHSHFGGEEIFVLSGSFMDEHGEYPAGSWLRSPHLSKHFPFAREETIIWVKTGHLFLEPSSTAIDGSSHQRHGSQRVFFV